jgi:pyruvate dehydrogenase phosphatase
MRLWSRARYARADLAVPLDSPDYAPSTKPGHKSTFSMRRAAAQGLQALRTARSNTVWRPRGRRASRAYFSSGQALAVQGFFTRKQTSYIPASIHASMHVRNFSLAFISTLVASGAWYAYKGTQPAFLNGTSGIQSRGIADTTSGNSPETTGTRRALLVENDQFYTSVLSDDQPLSKQSDDSDRRILEMLTPEQATQKLRKNDESYLVSRGQGVVRYDITQVPSNSPIEDDHAEKIVEVPQATSGAQDGSPSSDWMFWGVFDGHSYVVYSMATLLTC